jgi:hypothetical protein
VSQSCPGEGGRRGAARRRRRGVEAGRSGGRECGRGGAGPRPGADRASLPQVLVQELEQYQVGARGPRASPAPRAPPPRRSGVTRAPFVSFQLLPKRLDWEGNEHSRSYEELVSTGRGPLASPARPSPGSCSAGARCGGGRVAPGMAGLATPHPKKKKKKGGF